MKLALLVQDVEDYLFYNSNIVLGVNHLDVGWYDKYLFLIQHTFSLQHVSLAFGRSATDAIHMPQAHQEMSKRLQTIII